MTRELFEKRLRDGSVSGSAYVHCPALLGDELWHRADQTEFWSKPTQHTSRPSSEGPAPKPAQPAACAMPLDQRNATRPRDVAERSVFRPRVLGEILIGLLLTPFNVYLFWVRSTGAQTGRGVSGTAAIVGLACLLGSIYLLGRGLLILASWTRLVLSDGHITLTRWTRTVARKKLEDLQDSDWRVTQAKADPNPATAMFRFQHHGLQLNLGTAESPRWVLVDNFGVKPVLRAMSRFNCTKTPIAKAIAPLFQPGRQLQITTLLLFPRTDIFVTSAGPTLRLSRENDGAATAAIRASDDGTFYTKKIADGKVTVDRRELSLGDERQVTQRNFLRHKYVGIGGSSLELKLL